MTAEQTDNGGQRSVPVAERRPWDEVLEDFATRTGCPLWPVTRFDRSEVAA